LIRVGIIADTTAHSRTLADLLSDDDRFHIVNLSPFALEARESEFSYVDVVVVTSPALVRRMPGTGPPVIVVGRESNGRGGFRDPVRGWLPARPTSPELSAAITAVAQNFVVLTHDQAKAFVGQSRETQTEDEIGEALTARELEVLRMMADGLGNKAIANGLGISDHTAKFHVAQILAKLGAGSRAEAVALGMRRGLVPI
jgi:DNA-binding NarL/FixJ family response regulator